MLLGVGLVALPAGILAAKFSDELRTRKLALSEHIRVALEDGVITGDEYEAPEWARTAPTVLYNRSVPEYSVETWGYRP